MKQIATEGIILSRTDYGEADRIITLLTPDHGKLRLMAKGVRRIKSKLAGGIELFSVSSITFIPGRGEIGTLVSTRLAKHYGHIVEDLDRTMLGYELIKQLNKVTEDHPESGYFDLLHTTFEALDSPALGLDLIRFWFATHLLRLSGHVPNLHTDRGGSKLDAAQLYDLDPDNMCFIPVPHRGSFGASHIKFLRLSFEGHGITTLAAVKGADALLQTLTPTVQAMVRNHIR